MYKDYILINKNFQSSVNLELDLNNRNKIDEYIPTSDICDVLKRFIKSINGENNDKATILVGPYGKGKSFLLLVLSFIISQDPNTKVYKKLIRKIGLIDPDLANEISLFNESNRRLLPIIINSNYDNLSQAFMLSLNEAIKRDGLPDIIPETSYSTCISLINEWKSVSEKEFRKTLAKCQAELHTSLEKLEMGLKNYSIESYNQFVTLYNCVTHGMPFNPLINDDVVHVYSEVNYELQKHGYSGMFIIFDEFSKFLETANESVSKNLKIIQDFAELAARSSAAEQLHICCVTHKSFSLYKNSGVLDSFKTVEGRFKEIKFNRSLNENYQIISAAINNDNARELIKKYIETNKEFYDLLQDFEPFRTDVDLKDLYYGCFPLNPITVYSLIQLSELVAQNERTLFTFICDVDDNSLNSFVHTNSDGLFNVDKIYDYFSPLLKREEENSIRNIWYRSEGTLSRIEDNTQRKIVKTLAIILMINDPDNMPANEKMISMAIMQPMEVVSGYISDLIDNRLLRKNPLNNLLSFASSNNKQIEDQISIIAQTKSRSISYESILEDINEYRYLLPRRYNEQNKITRFYRVSFITEDQLVKLSSLKSYKDRGFSDGVVLNLIRVNMSESQIREEFLKYDDSQIILRYPLQPVSPIMFTELTRFASLQEILYKGGNDPVVTNEIDLLLQETEENIKELISKSFEINFKCLSTIVNTYKTFNDLLSDQFDKVFYKKIIFNNELINKNSVSTAYQKAVNNVVDDLINKRDTEYSPTSPETTIKKSVLNHMDQPHVKEVTENIKDTIRNAEHRKVRISSFIERYTSAPYGVRLGIMTILVAQCIYELSDNILLYLKEKEIDFTAGNLYKAVNTDGEYYFRSPKGSKAQAKYMNDLFKAFKKEPSRNFRADTKALCEEYRKFFVGLPMVIKNLSSGNAMGIPEEIIKYKNVYTSFAINAYEAVFDQPLIIYQTDNYKRFTKDVMAFIRDWETYLFNFKREIINLTKVQFCISHSTSLRMGLNSLAKEYIKNGKPILSDRNANILSTIESISFDDCEAINQISNVGLGVYIEDWTEDRTSELLNVLISFFEALSSTKKIDTSLSTVDKLFNETRSKEQSAMGELLKNSVNSVLDEFGDSVSTEEKIAILTELLKKYL